MARAGGCRRAGRPPAARALAARERSSSARPTPLNTAIKALVRRRRPRGRRPARAHRHPDEAQLPLARTPRRRSPPRAPTGACCRPRRSTRRRRRWRASRVYLGVHYPSDVAAGRAARAGHGERGAMKVGIVGMPNAGKSSLFNALTRAGAEAANYPFTTIEPNVAVVPVVDERLDRVARDDRLLERRATTRSTSTTSPASCAAPARARGWATSSWPTSARSTPSSTSCAPTTTTTSSTPRATSTRAATSTRSRPSCSTPTSSRPSAAWSA